MVVESYVVVHNIAKPHDVGILARSATAFGVSELILVGRRTSTPSGATAPTPTSGSAPLPLPLLKARSFLKENDRDICSEEIIVGAAAVNDYPFKRSTASLLRNEVHTLYDEIDDVDTESYPVTELDRFEPYWTASRLEGKVALITGGASGIGECTSRVFASHGAKVVIADIQDELGHSVCSSIGPSSASYVHCDVTDEDQVKNAVQKAVSAHGKLDIMFNNAGIDENRARIIHSEKADFERVLRINVTGVFLGMKHAAKAMIPARSGCILSTASISSSLAGAASHAYTCSKHAVVGLTRNASVELGQFGIRVNCLSPYGVATPLAMSLVGADAKTVEGMARAMANLKGVTLKAEDVANAALYLASEEGRYISGHNLFIDGGFTTLNSSINIFQGPIDA